MQEKAQSLPPSTSSHLDGCGHRAALAELDFSQPASPAVTDDNVLTEDSSRDYSTVLSEDL